MPIYIKQDAVKFRQLQGNQYTGNYYGVDTISDTTTEEKVAEINSAANSAMNNINNTANSAISNINTASNAAKAQADTLKANVQTIADAIEHAEGNGVDPNLTLPNVAAEAKATGDAIGELKSAEAAYNENTIGITTYGEDYDDWTNNYAINQQGEITSLTGAHYSGLISVGYSKTKITVFATAQNMMTRIHGYDVNGDWDKELYHLQLPVNKETSIVLDTSDVSFIRISTNNVNIIKYIGIERPIITDIAMALKPGGVNIQSSNWEQICQSDLNNVPLNTVYVVVPGSGLQHYPVLQMGVLISLSKTNTMNNGIAQLYFAYGNKLYSRMYSNNAWSDWGEISTPSSIVNSVSTLNTNVGTLQTDVQTLENGLANALKGSTLNITSDNRETICQSDLNNAPLNQVFVVVPDAGLAHYPKNRMGTFIALSKQNTINNGIAQLYLTSECELFVRNYYSGTWSDWVQIGQGQSVNTTGTYYVATNGNDSNPGTYSSPFATVNKALTSGANQIGVFGGIYDQQIDISKSKNNELKIFNVTPTKRVIFRDPNYLLTTSETAVTGYTKVYSATVTKTIATDNIWIYQDGIADPNTLISEQDRHPLQRRFTHRCEDTVIRKCDASTTSDALSEIENASENVFKWYKDGNTLYFSRPSAVTAQNPICYSSGLQLMENKAKQYSLTAIGIETKYMGFALDTLSDARLTDCRCINAFSPSGFRYAQTNVRLERCEVCHTCHSTYGDGISANSEMTNDPDAPQTKCILVDCYSHDNHDDGFSDHVRCESTIIGGLYEYNGKGGITPAMGAHCSCFNTMSRYNHYGFCYTISPTESADRKFGDVICYGTVAIGNDAGYSSIGNGNKMWLYDCRAIDNNIGFSTSQSGVLYMVDCYQDNNNTVKSGNNIVVSNTQLVS